ncbi:hypothetical protein COOONC_10163 [Cooperia oncophora]
MPRLRNVMTWLQMWISRKANVEFGAAVTKIFSNGSGSGGLDTGEFLRKFSLVTGDVLRVFTRFSAPTRWHYSGSSEAADVLVVAHGGNELCWYIAPAVLLSENTFRNCDGGPTTAIGSGYEYQDQEMQTIFYAQGPSIRSAVTVPPFQNIELMNLWIELLKIGICTK